MRTEIYITNATRKSRRGEAREAILFAVSIIGFETQLHSPSAHSAQPSLLIPLRELLCVCWRGFRPLPRRRGRRRWKLYLRLSHFPARKGPRRGLRRKGVIPNCGGKSCYPLCRYWTADQEAEFHRTSDFSNKQAELERFLFGAYVPTPPAGGCILFSSQPWRVRRFVPRIAHFSAQRCLLISRPSADGVRPPAHSARLSCHKESFSTRGGGEAFDPSKHPLARLAPSSPSSLSLIQCALPSFLPSLPYDA